MCMIDDGDRPEFWSEKSIRKSRKEHKCEECGRAIAVGEPCWYGFGKQDGYTYSSRTCTHCRVIADWLLRNCRGFVYGAMIEDFGNHAEANVAMLRIVVGARRGWRRFGDRAQLMAVPSAPADMH